MTVKLKFFMKNKQWQGHWGCQSLRCQQVGLLRTQVFPEAGETKPPVHCKACSCNHSYWSRSQTSSHPLIYIPSSSQDLHQQQSHCLLQPSPDVAADLCCSSCLSTLPALQHSSPCCNNKDAPCRIGKDSWPMMRAKGQQEWNKRQNLLKQVAAHFWPSVSDLREIKLSRSESNMERTWKWKCQ